MEERRSKEHVLGTEIYTDGSLKKIGHMTFGGWAFVVVKDSQCLYCGFNNEYDTTNQRMELTAMVEALKYISERRHPNERITIYSDSAYIINCYLQDWYIKWQSNNWMTAANKPVANIDLWQQLVPYFDSFWYTFKKVEGHSGVYWNEECDNYAQMAADSLKKSWRGTKNEDK